MILRGPRLLPLLLGVLLAARALADERLDAIAALLRIESPVVAARVSLGGGRELWAIDGVRIGQHLALALTPDAPEGAALLVSAPPLATLEIGLAPFVPASHLVEARVTEIATDVTTVSRQTTELILRTGPAGVEVACQLPGASQIRPVPGPCGAGSSRTVQIEQEPNPANPEVIRIRVVTRDSDDRTVASGAGCDRVGLPAYDPTYAHYEIGKTGMCTLLP